MVKALLPVYICLIGGIPLLTAFGPFFWIEQRWAQLTWLFFCLPVFAFAYVTTAGVLSRFTLPAMVRGKFPRDLKHPVYGPRRLHALCWTSVYYCTPIYFAVLTFPALKAWVFTLFGYKHSTNFTVYPDTWLRDLPVLKIEEGAYLSNRATIGTNMCLTDGTVLVDSVVVKKKGLVGHLCMLAPGTYIGSNAELGVGAGLGVRSKLSENSSVGPMSTVGHGVVIEANSHVGMHSHIGTKVLIRSGVRLSPGANIPPGAVIVSQRDADAFISSELSQLSALRDALALKVSAENKNLEDVKERTLSVAKHDLESA
jgi:carbonic anhydrase/acetyltransferase-like protein (isoleucine patch superfamily)